MEEEEKTTRKGSRGRGSGRGRGNEGSERAWKPVDRDKERENKKKLADSRWIGTSETPIAPSRRRHDRGNSAETKCRTNDATEK